VNSTAPRTGVLAALPLAAALTLLLVYWLPVHFDYVENDLGIVSRATLDRYPQQQETFWLVVSLVVGAVLTWGLARRFGAAPAGMRRIQVEGLGVAALLCALWMPPLISTALVLVCVGGALWLAEPKGASNPLAEDTPAKPALLSPVGLASTAVAALVIATLITPSITVDLWSVANDIEDASRVSASFTFQGEMGQHLAWANALRRGGFHGRDFFCLYGPLYDLGLVGMWELVGRSVVAWELYFSITRVLGATALLLLVASLVRRPAWMLIAPFLVPWVNLRIGLALFGLVVIGGWLRRDSRVLATLAGAIAGTSLLYSQEFGLAFVLTAVAAFGVRRAWRAAALFLGMAVVVMTPLVAWYAAHDALGPMLRDMIAYPGYMVAGYGKLPFPALASALPLDLGSWGSRELLAFEYGYAVPFLCFGALFWSLRLSSFEFRRPILSAGRMLDSLGRDSERFFVGLVAIFGLLTFRSALGRSDLVHMIAILPAAAALLIAAWDRILDGGWSRRETPARTLWCAALLIVMLLLAGFVHVPQPFRNVRQFGSNLATLMRQGHHPTGDPNVRSVMRWIQAHSGEDDPVLFLPNNAAYYYLTDRPSPVRFVMGHQIVTQAHRDEVFEALASAPPRYIVWDHAALRVDGVEDDLVFGRPLLDWIDQNYRPALRFDDVEILEHSGSEGAAFENEGFENEGSANEDSGNEEAST